MSTNPYVIVSTPEGAGEFTRNLAEQLNQAATTNGAGVFRVVEGDAGSFLDVGSVNVIVDGEHINVIPSRGTTGEPRRFKIGSADQTETALSRARQHINRIVEANTDDYNYETMGNIDA